MNAEYTGKKIAELRKAKNMTQRELAGLVHVTDKAVSKWERGVNFPDLSLMEDLAKHLDATPAVLLGLESASQDEIVSSFTELSSRQAKDAARDIQKVSWLNLADWYGEGDNWGKSIRLTENWFWFEVYY